MLKIILLSILLISFAKCILPAAQVVSNDTTLWPSQLYKTEDFSAPRVAISKLGTTSPGFFFVTLFGPETNSTTVLIMTEQGQLVWRPEARFVGTNFAVQQFHGTIVLTYWNGTIDGAIGAGYGSIYILDSGYNTIYTICGADLDVNPLPGLNLTTDCKLDFHEVKISAKGTLLAMARSVLSGVDLAQFGGPVDGYVLDSLFYELDITTGEVLFRWSAYEHRASLPPTLSHYPINAQLAAAGGTSPADPWDYFHMNSIDDIGDNFLISSRFYCSAIKLNRQGDVEWVLNVSSRSSSTQPASLLHIYSSQGRRRRQFHPSRQRELPVPASHSRCAGVRH